MRLWDSVFSLSIAAKDKLIMEAFIEGVCSASILVSQILQHFFQIITGKIMSLETAADVATIIAAFLGTGAILSWFTTQFYKLRPFAVKRFIYSRLQNTDGPAYFQIDFKNRLPHEITIKSASLMEPTRYEVQELDGVMRSSSLMSYVTSASINGDIKKIDPEANGALLFEYKKTSQADNDIKLVDSVLINTNRGSFKYRLGKPDVWETQGGMVGYSDIAYTRLGRYWCLLRYHWWKYCLGVKLQAKYKKRFDQ